MRPTIDETAGALIDGFTRLSDDEQRLAQTVYRLVGRGRPAPVEAIAADAGWATDDVEERLRAWPAVFRNDPGAVVGFWGLAADAVTSHRIDLHGVGTAWTWCSYDTLFIPELVGTTAHVGSVCATTGEPIGLTVTSDDVVDVEPAEAVVSLLVPDGPFDDDVRQSFCHYVLFFTSPDAAEEWTNKNPGTFWLPVAEAFEVARRANAAVFPALVGTKAER